MTLKKSNRILKKKAVLHEREIARFSKSLKQKDKELEQNYKELEQKDKDLDLERSLWNSRKAEWDSGAGRDLHRIEVFDGIISDESNLHSGDSAKHRRVPVHLATCGGVRDGLRRDAAVSATTNPGSLIPVTGASCASGTPCWWHLFVKKTIPHKARCRQSLESTRPACAGTSRSWTRYWQRCFPRPKTSQKR